MTTNESVEERSERRAQARRSAVKARPAPATPPNDATLGRNLTTRVKAIANVLLVAIVTTVGGRSVDAQDVMAIVEELAPGGLDPRAIDVATVRQVLEKSAAAVSPASPSQ